MYDKDTTILKYADWLSEAEKEIRQLNTGQQFILSDLFQGYKWKRLSKADRSFLGNLFLRTVWAGDIKGVRWRCRSSEGNVYEICSPCEE